MVYKVLIMAGGTGGHVFPGIAIAHALQKQGVEVSWLGTQGGMEVEWVNEAKLPIDVISIKGLRGNGWKGWLKAPWNITHAWWQARQVMKRFRPDLVLGMGGFVCGPGGLAAKSLGVPLVLHEQNAIPGMTNKWLAKIANHVVTAFPQNVIKGKRVELLGNPVREGMEEVAVLQPRKRCRLLVLGGSRGALALNEMVPRALALLDVDERPQVIHQTGSKTLQEATEAYELSGVEAHVTPFIDDMLKVYDWADMVVSRSGALTVSELMATARPAIMVPYPHAVDDHQTANAQALVSLTGGEVIQQDELEASDLADKLALWCVTSDRRVTASNAIREHAPKQATQKIVARLLTIIQEKNGG